MWRSTATTARDAVCDRRGAFGVAIVFVLTVVVSYALAEPKRLRRVVSSGVETVIGAGVRWNKRCEAIGVPLIILDKPPDNGVVCVRMGTVRPTTLLYGASAHCLKSAMQGAQIIYQSRRGFGGRDALGYRLKFPRFEQEYSVNIEVRTPDGARTAPEPSFVRQQPGPVPECAALVSWAAR